MKEQQAPATHKLMGEDGKGILVYAGGIDSIHRLVLPIFLKQLTM